LFLEQEDLFEEQENLVKELEDLFEELKDLRLNQEILRSFHQNFNFIEEKKRDRQAVSL